MTTAESSHAEELGDDLDDPVAAALAEKLAAAGIEVPGLADDGPSRGTSGSGRADSSDTSAGSSANQADRPTGPVLTDEDGQNQRDLPR